MSAATGPFARMPNPVATYARRYQRRFPVSKPRQPAHNATVVQAVSSMSMVRICPMPKKSGEVARMTAAINAVAGPYIAFARTKVAPRTARAEIITGRRQTASFTPNRVKPAAVIQ